MPAQANRWAFLRILCFKRGSSQVGGPKLRGRRNNREFSELPAARIYSTVMALFSENSMLRLGCVRRCAAILVPIICPGWLNPLPLSMHSSTDTVNFCLALHFNLVVFRDPKPKIQFLYPQSKALCIGAGHALSRVARAPEVGREGIKLCSVQRPPRGSFRGEGVTV